MQSRRDPRPNSRASATGGALCVSTCDARASTPCVRSAPPPQFSTPVHCHCLWVTLSERTSLVSLVASRPINAGFLVLGHDRGTSISDGSWAVGNCFAVSVVRKIGIGDAVASQCRPKRLTIAGAGRDTWAACAPNARKTVCAFVALDSRLGGRSASPLAVTHGANRWASTRDGRHRSLVCT